MSDAPASPATADEGAPPASAEGGVHRLLDMLVEEVSLVDRAANKRRFLVVKRESEMAKKKTEETTPAKPGAVGATAGGGAGKKPPPKAKKPPKKPDAETEKAKKPPPAKDPPEEEEEEEEEDGKTSKAFPPKKDPDEEDEEEEEEQEEEPEGAPASEDEPSGKPAGKKPPKKAEKDADGAPALGAPDDEAPDDDETPLSVALAALDSLTQAVEILSDSPEDGSQLASIAENIRAAADAISSAAGIEPDNDENEEPGGEASIAGLVSSIQEMLTKIESLTQALSAESKTPATAPTITAETQAPPDLAGTLAEVSQSMKSIDASVKTQAARLSALEKRAGVPNSQPPGERVTKTEPEDASWPIDMNRPRDRASVDKAVSFHDD